MVAYWAHNPEICQFESGPRNQNADVAQLVEHLIGNEEAHRFNPGHQLHKMAA